MEIMIIMYCNLHREYTITYDIELVLGRLFYDASIQERKTHSILEFISL